MSMIIVGASLRPPAQPALLVGFLQFARRSRMPLAGLGFVPADWVRMTTAVDDEGHCGPKRCACLLKCAGQASVKPFAYLEKLPVDLILDPCMAPMVPRSAVCQRLLASAKSLHAVRRERVETRENVFADAEALVVDVPADEFASWHDGGCAEEGGGERVDHVDLGLRECALTRKFPKKGVQ